MKPTIGRIVHYQCNEDQPPLAAIVTGIHEDGTLSLFIMGRTGTAQASLIPYAYAPKPGCWSWPPREESPNPLPCPPVTGDFPRVAYCSAAPVEETAGTGAPTESKYGYFPKDVTEKLRRKAMTAGYNGNTAWSEGKDLDSNPYPEDHYLHVAWKAGWEVKDGGEKEEVQP